jgi:hypothetical protein
MSLGDRQPEHLEGMARAPQMVDLTVALSGSLKLTRVLPASVLPRQRDETFELQASDVLYKLSSLPQARSASGLL